MIKIRQSKVLLLLLSVSFGSLAAQQNTIRVAPGKPELSRIAVPDFRPLTRDSKTTRLNVVLNQTLWSELERYGNFEMVAKSIYPRAIPAFPLEFKMSAWSAPPLSTDMIVFGNISVAGGRVTIHGWLFDERHSLSQQVLDRQYEEEATENNTKLIGHRFAEEIVFSSLNDFSSRYGWYVDLVKSKVVAAWHIPADHDAAGRWVRIGFEIQPDGSPSNVRVEQSSGIPVLDESAIRAIQRIDSFGPPPTHRSVTVEFVFNSPKAKNGS